MAAIHVDTKMGVGTETTSRKGKSANCKNYIL
jgi:hypothetical protein